MTNIKKLILSFLLLAIWTLFYEFVNRVLKVKASKFGQIDTKNRIVSILHGQISFWLCTLTLIFNPNLEKTENCHTVNIILLISMSYFIYDTLGCLYYNLIDYWMLFHHIVCIAIEALALFSIGFKESYFIILGLSIAEISNFTMHMTEILKNLGLQLTKIYQIIENSYFFLYCLARGLISPIFLLIPVWMNPSLYLGIKIMVLFIHVQSFHVIFTSIRTSIFNNRKQEQEMKRKGVQYQWFEVNTQNLKELSFFDEKQRKQE